MAASQQITGRFRVPGRRARLARGARAVVERVGLLLVLLVLWQLATEAGGSMHFPPPLTIFDRVRELWLSGPADHAFVTGRALDDVVPSVARMLGAWVLGSAIGVVTGVGIGLSPRVREYLEPSLHFVRSLPAPALVPVFLLVLGVGSSARVALAAFGVVWIVMINTSQAVASVDALMLETARAYQLPFRRRILQVVLPGASPPIFAAMRIGLSLTLILMVLSEMIAGVGGIGFQLVQAQNSFALVDVWATMVLLGVLGIVLNSAFSAAEHRMLAWHRGSRSSDKR